MEDLSIVLPKIKIPTNKVNSESLQEVLKATKNKSKQNVELWNEVVQILWTHLQTGFNNFDDQLLCSTCFYSALILTNKQEFYLHEVVNIINEEIDVKENENKDNSRIIQTVSLMYGMFQSSFLTQLQTEAPIVIAVLESTFKLLRIIAYEYSRYTFIVFKAISSFKKVCSTNLEKYLFSKENIVALLNLVNHNWENPISGVRDLNRSIFQTILSMMDEDMFKTLLEEINGFYWNKAKFLMLAEIVGYKKTNSIIDHTWIDGLVSSLYKPGFVSAGADMYFAIMKTIKTEAEWSNIFLKSVIEVLSGSSKKAIENFSNYWCLTTLKSYPVLLETFIRELQDITYSENKLYSSLSIMKQGNKVGLLTKVWDSNEYNFTVKTVLDGLDHCDNQTRMMAFDIICVSQTKVMPTQLEYELVLKYLHHNVNSDCTVLRLNMLKSLNNFLTQLHVSYLNYLNSNQENDIENFKDFSKKFQELILQNFEMGGNYQRKITCIKLAHIFLNSLNELPKKRQKQTRKSHKTIIQMLKEEDQWLMSEERVLTHLVKLLKDPAEDIRENVGQLLLEHYSIELGKETEINLLIKDALKSMNSKFFYEISCGQSMFKLIINLLLRETHAVGIFKTVEDVFNFSYKELINEYKLKRTIVESIEMGKQLHSFMIILQTVLGECYHNKHDIGISIERIIELLDVLNNISNQFSWEQETSTSSDFAKMSDMVENIITTSGYVTCNDKDQTKISGLHQIVLNCLWLNVKASCDLSSLLIKYQKNDTQIQICEKALDNICHILETCRHKGAIEAAGTALGQSIQHLTSASEDLELSKLPLVFLRAKLTELIAEAGRMASITRRGAGLSIMVHRIVSSDAKKGKPLFHYFMKTVLETCNNTTDIPNELDKVQNVNNQKDLPKAIYIHFLTRIVMDSSLASDMMFYSAELAELAFGNLTSPHWQIRNAALQLYGALIQKLIGQKKASAADEETIATVAFDEVRTHSTKLWNYIQRQLKNENYTDKVQYHSNLVPILNMLANIAPRYNFSSDMLQQRQTDVDFLTTLMLLLDSPIYTVRRLTAKCIFNIYPFEVIYYDLLVQECLSENHLHGVLMLMANYHKLHQSDSFYKSKLNDMKKKFSDVMNTKVHSYLCRAIYEDIFYNSRMHIECIEKMLVEVNCNIYAPGISLWSSRRLQKYLFNAPWDKIPEVLQLFLSHNEFENYCEALSDRIINDDITDTTMLNIMNILLHFQNKFRCGVIWKILYQISLKIDPLELKLLDISEVNKFLEDNVQVSYKLRYIIPFAARMSVIEGDKKCILNITKIVASLTDPKVTDIDMRQIAAMANNEIGTNFLKLPEEVKIMTIKSAVILLQDEIEDVRIISAAFYKKITNIQRPLQPYVCLLRIMDSRILRSLLSESAICNLSTQLLDFVSHMTSSKTVDKYNPFANDCNNIYFEDNVFRQMIKKLNSV